MERIERPSASEELQGLNRRYDELTAIAVQLVEECARLRAENDDLRASAEIWIKMYEHQADRAASFEEQLLGGPRRG
jgi:regulator of replication initiation timing